MKKCHGRLRLGAAAQLLWTNSILAAADADRFPIEGSPHQAICENAQNKADPEISILMNYVYLYIVCDPEFSRRCDGSKSIAQHV